MKIRLAAIILATTAMCVVGFSQSADARLAANRLASNQLASNRLASNRLASNRLASNRLASNRLASNRVASGDGNVVAVLSLELPNGERYDR
jgi:hypothetical protein